MLTGRAATLLLVSSTEALVLSHVECAALMCPMRLTAGIPAWLRSISDPAVTHLLVPLCCRLSILDLVVAMAPYADEPSLGSLYRTIQPSLQVSHPPAPQGQGVQWGTFCLLPTRTHAVGG